MRDYAHIIWLIRGINEARRRRGKDTLRTLSRVHRAAAVRPARGTRPGYLIHWQTRTVCHCPVDNYYAVLMAPSGIISTTVGGGVWSARGRCIKELCCREQDSNHHMFKLSDFLLLFVYNCVYFKQPPVGYVYGETEVSQRLYAGADLHRPG